MNWLEHKREAERLLEEGVEVVRRIADADDYLKEKMGLREPSHSQVVREVRDELGKKVRGIWAQAQVHATLATLKDGP